MAAARRFLQRAINLHDLPERTTIDRSCADTAAFESVKADTCVGILMHQENAVIKAEREAEEVHPVHGFPGCEPGAVDGGPATSR